MFLFEGHTELLQTSQILWLQMNFHSSTVRLGCSGAIGRMIVEIVTRIGLPGD